jgi:hypothetical protein
MAEITYTCFVPRSKRDELREVLETENTGGVRWRERRTFSGSEFSFTGPSQTVRKAHTFLTRWVAQD